MTIKKDVISHINNYPGYILVTGAGGGIGLSLVDYLLTRGNRAIACQYRTRREGLDEIFRKHGLSPNEFCFYADLTEESQVRELREWANQKFGSIWGLINLAGTTTNSMSWKLPKEDFMKVIKANLLTTFLCTKEFIPDFRERAGGRIINCSSVVAFSGVIGASHYAAAKAGINGFTKAIALELASKNVTANTLTLGYYEYGLINMIPIDIQDEIKKRTPLKRFGKANEIGSIIDYLLCEDSGFTTGQDFHINGGIRI